MVDQEYRRAIRRMWNDPDENQEFDGDTYREDLEGIGEFDDEVKS